ncbi:3'-5' exonuclease [Clostridium peptidivorans]|uniref:3'-5' exonuclease n=1 Tax=Clostridium peptidivorans TaxID=100174 RepID=UPI000BE3D0B0|nr:3'-5' exonuclease [Clostridium peptidivorans]
MNYIVFDLEFNQAYRSKKEKSIISNEKCPFEIIQIGAIKLDKNFQKIQTFNKLIKPHIYTTLNPFVENLTGITINDLNSSKPFKDIYEEFVNFIQGDKNILCVWGLADIKELFRNIKYHNLDISIIPKEYINLQQFASKYLKCPKGIHIGLNKAVNLLNIPLDSKFHNAFADAYYTTEVFKKIYNDKIQIKTYNPISQRTQNALNKEKKEVDYYGLIKQFEKMFNREMSEEEKKIIKLSYIMGKTNQFQVKSPKEASTKK